MEETLLLMLVGLLVLGCVSLVINAIIDYARCKRPSSSSKNGQPATAGDLDRTPPTGHEGFGSGLISFNDKISKYREIEIHIYPINSSIDLEKIHIEGAIRRANRSIEIKNQKDSDPLFAKFYDEVLAEQKNILNTYRNENCTIISESQESGPPNFELTQGAKNSPYADEIRLSIERLKNDRKAWLLNKFRFISTNHELNSEFWLAMRSPKPTLISENLHKIFLQWQANENRDQRINTQPQKKSRISLESIRGVLELSTQHASDAASAFSTENRASQDHVLQLSKMEAIQQIALQKSIPFLVHFTQVQNLPTIFERGLFSIEQMQKRNLNFRSNDNLRLDNYLDAISVSIAHPNEKLFYRWRRENPQQRWAVLILDKRILWENDVKFCACNAADSRAQKNELAGYDAQALTQMYAEREDIISRNEQGLKPYDPSDVQAEVLCRDYIAPDAITGVAFSDPTVLRIFATIAGDRDVTLQNDGVGLFGPRSTARNMSVKWAPH